jgi:hypothetical protein
MTTCTRPSVCEVLAFGLGRDHSEVWVGLFDEVDQLAEHARVTGHVDAIGLTADQEHWSDLS